MQYDDDSELVQSVNKFIEPSVVKHFETRFQPYKMIFNKQLKKLVTFSEDKYVSAWDIEHFKPVIIILIYDIIIFYSIFFIL